MFYLDTSVVLALFIHEPMSESVGNWVASRRQPLAFSDWGLTECASALGILQRRGSLAADSTARTYMAITTFVNTSCEFIACASHHQIEAQKLLSRFDLPIRAGDALHLAVSLHAQASLVSCDKQLVAVAKAIGAKVRNPLSPPANRD